MKGKLHLLKSLPSLKIQILHGSHTWPAKTTTQLTNGYLILSNASDLSDLGVKLGRVRKKISGSGQPAEAPKSLGLPLLPTCLVLNSLATISSELHK